MPDTTHDLAKAQFFLGLSLHTNGKESLNAYRQMQRIMHECALEPETFGLSQHQMMQVGAAAATEFVPHQINLFQQDLAHPGRHTGVTVGIHLTCRILEEFNDFLPDTKNNWSAALSAMGAYLARYREVDEAFDHADRLIQGRRSFTWRETNANERLLGEANNILQRAGVHIYTLGGYGRWNFDNIRNHRRDNLPKIPDIEVIPADSDHIRLAAQIDPATIAPYLNLTGLRDTVVTETGRTRIEALDELMKAGQRIGVSIGSAQSRSDFRLPVQNLGDLRMLGQLEILTRDVQQSPTFAPREWSRLSFSGTALLAGPRRGELEGVVDTALSTLRHNVMASFAQHVSRELMRPNPPSETLDLIRDFGFGGHIDHANWRGKFVNYLQKKIDIEIRSWEPVSAAIEGAKTTIIQQPTRAASLVIA